MTTILHNYRCADCDTRFMNPWLATTDPVLRPTCMQNKKALAACVPPASVRQLARASS